MTKAVTIIPTAFQVISCLFSSHCFFSFVFIILLLIKKLLYCVKNGYIVYAQYNHYHNSLEIPLRIPNPIQKSTHFHYIAYNNIINYIIPYINPIISIFTFLHRRIWLKCQRIIQSFYLKAYSFKDNPSATIFLSMFAGGFVSHF